MNRIVIGISVSAVLLGILCPSDSLLAQQVKRVAPISNSVFVFQPIHPGGRHKSVVVEVRGHKGKDEFGRERIDSWEITLLSVHNRQRTILSKTPVEGEDLFWFDASLYRHRKSRDYLLAIKVNGGQHDHTQVYYIDPNNFHVRPLFAEIGIIYGDTGELAKGRLREHSPDQYVDPDLKTKGFKRREGSKGEYLARTWTYPPRTHRFVESPYWWEK